MPRADLLWVLSLKSRTGALVWEPSQSRKDLFSNPHPCPVLPALPPLPWRFSSDQDTSGYSPQAERRLDHLQETATQKH